jgi:hypothetical protein
LGQKKVEKNIENRVAGQKLYTAVYLHGREKYFQNGRGEKKYGSQTKILASDERDGADLSVPKNQPMAMVWKKQTQRRAMPEAE